jgi:D-alanyl-D-alanine carboxypeptidase/D-alanyl-D-alanine-endopeptidase (penicillin-binding protein 4)
MSSVVAEMLGNSDNNTAELVVKELGVTDTSPGTREAGLAVIRDQLAEWGVSVDSLALADGSGLSPDNRTTCAALAEVLARYDLDSPVGQGLPIAGQTGTLSDVFVGHSVDGRLRGKTGTLNNPPFNADPPAVKALGGYLPIEGGGEVEYVLILNGPTISDQSEYRPIWDALADTLDTYPAGPTPAMLGPR